MCFNFVDKAPNTAVSALKLGLLLAATVELILTSAHVFLVCPRDANYSCLCRIK